MYVVYMKTIWIYMLSDKWRTNSDTVKDTINVNTYTARPVRWREWIS